MNATEASIVHKDAQWFQIFTVRLKQNPIAVAT